MTLTPLWRVQRYSEWTGRRVQSASSANGHSNSSFVSLFRAPRFRLYACTPAHAYCASLNFTSILTVFSFFLDFFLVFNAFRFTFFSPFLFLLYHFFLLFQILDFVCLFFFFFFFWLIIVLSFFFLVFLFLFSFFLFFFFIHFHFDFFLFVSFSSYLPVRISFPFLSIQMQLSSFTSLSFVHKII